MTVYVDLVFFLNLFFDFLLLLTVNNTLKRNTSLKRIFLGALVGSITIFTLFLSISSILLFVFKVVLSIVMCTITFGIKDKKYVIQNLSYFYMTSTVLGGFLYFLNLTFAESHYGLVFSYESISVNYLFLVIFSPVMLYIYVKQRKSVVCYGQYYRVVIHFLNGGSIEVNSYLDTGNKLIDPVTKKKIVIVNEKKIPKNVRKQIIYVPYNTLNYHGLMKCFKIDSLEINGKMSKNYLVGISEGELLRDGVDCILNFFCAEEML